MDQYEITVHAILESEIWLEQAFTVAEFRPC